MRFEQPQDADVNDEFGSKRIELPCRSGVWVALALLRAALHWL